MPRKKSSFRDLLKDSKILREYLGAGQMKGKRLRCAEDYQGIGTEALAAITLRPRGRPKRHMQTVIRVFKTGNRGMTKKSFTEVAEVILRRAFRNKVLIGKKRCGVSMEDAKVALQVVTLRSGEVVKDFRVLVNYGWDVVATALCRVPLIKKPVSIRTLLRLLGLKPVKREFILLGKRLFDSSFTIGGGSPNNMERPVSLKMRELIRSGVNPFIIQLYEEFIPLDDLFEFLKCALPAIFVRQSYDLKTLTWKWLFRRAYGVRAMKDFLKKQGIPSVVNKMLGDRRLLSKYLRCGSGRGGVRLSTPSDYIGVGPRKLVFSRYYCKPVGKKRVLISALLNQLGGQGTGTLLKLLILGFGFEKVRESLEGF